jgi:hypothetical protein
VNYRTLHNASLTAIRDLALRSNPKHTEGLPRVLCWVMCDPSDLQKRVIHVNATWARHCDVTLYMSSSEDKAFPAIGLDVPPGKDHIGAKSKAAWTYVYHHYLEQADYFVKCDPDTFLIVHTLKRYLASRDPKKAEYFGHRFYYRGMKTRQYLYNSGGPGQVLSREAVKTLVTQAFKMEKDCMPDGQGNRPYYVSHETIQILILISDPPTSISCRQSHIPIPWYDSHIIPYRARNNFFKFFCGNFKNLVATLV